MDSRRRKWIITGSALLLIFACAWLACLRLTRYERAYANLKPETAKEEVVRQFGKPDTIEGCRSTPVWDDRLMGKQSAKCIEEFRYYYRFRVGAWIVGFDANGRAVTKYYESSP